MQCFFPAHNIASPSTLQDLFSSFYTLIKTFFFGLIVISKGHWLCKLHRKIEVNLDTKRKLMMMMTKIDYRAIASTLVPPHKICIHLFDFCFIYPNILQQASSTTRLIMKLPFVTLCKSFLLVTLH